MKSAIFILLLFFISDHIYAGSSDSVSGFINNSSPGTDTRSQLEIRKQTVVSGGSQNVNIPYKEDKDLSQQATPVITALFIFAIFVVAFLYFFKKKLTLVGEVNGKNINILEIKRLNTRLTVFHLKIKNRELLILQSGDNVKTVELDSIPDDLEGL